MLLLLLLELVGFGIRTQGIEKDGFLWDGSFECSRSRYDTLLFDNDVVTASLHLVLCKATFRGAENSPTKLARLLERDCNKLLCLVL